MFCALFSVILCKSVPVTETRSPCFSRSILRDRRKDPEQLRASQDLLALLLNSEDEEGSSSGGCTFHRGSAVFGPFRVSVVLLVLL